MITVDNITEEFVSRYGYFYPGVGKDLVQAYLDQAPAIVRSCPDIRFVVNLFRDWLDKQPGYIEEK